ncbi:NUDIX domain-containing protein [Thauera phenylacetica]|uniref:NUDIX domain-containing protein n=1 Tax=Thauera phenylacetica TaxID=164400 RepID=UPI003522D06B
MRSGPAGPELLLGLRNNSPAKGWWFTPGGRIRKNEPLYDAQCRVAKDEIGLKALSWNAVPLLVFSITFTQTVRLTPQPQPTM